MANFDQDADGSLSKQEACAGITNTWDRYDQDGDEAVTKEELAARFQQWSEDDTGMMNLLAEVKYKGQHIEGALVELTPYAFLGENFKGCSGKTDRYGFASIRIPKDQLPKSQQGVFGVQVGLYQVSITHPNKKIPAKYNDESELSVDLSPLEANTGLNFNLR